MEPLAGRYALENEVARGHGRTLWRGRDTVLDRDVGVLLLDPAHPHADAVLQAARRAASVEHPGLLRVIDTAEDAGRVFVVTRWLSGAPLSDQLAAGPLSPDEARIIVTAVAAALAAAAEEDVHHLVLDPRDVLITDHGVVLVGIGVRAALEGVAPEADAEQVDAWRLGALLYAALTARWPGHECAGLPAAPVVAGRLARPRQVRAGVPTELDDVAWRSVDPESPHPLDTPAQVSAALQELGPQPSEDSSARSVTPPSWRWLGAVVVIALFSLAAVLIAWQVWQTRERPQADPGAGSTPTASPTDRPTGPSTPLEVRRAVAFDPSGDGAENDADASLAVDGDPGTAWTTVTYATRDLGGLKPGVGLRLELGPGRAVGGIELQLVGRGSDLTVVAARPRTDPLGGPPRTPDPENPLAGYRRLASVRGASDLVTLRFAPPVVTDRVLIWFTALPAGSGGYQGGVAEATVLP